MDIMVDIEALGTGRDATIIQVGAVAFNPAGMGDEFLRNVSPRNQNRALDPDTIMWWLKQDKDAQEGLFDPQAVPIKDFRNDFRRWVEGIKPRNVWANGASYDLIILRDVFGGYPPWTYKAEMCMRPLRLLGEECGLFWAAYFDKDFGPHHNALADAKRQAQFVIDFYKEMLREQRTHAPASGE